MLLALLFLRDMCSHSNIYGKPPYYVLLIAVQIVKSAVAVDIEFDCLPTDNTGCSDQKVFIDIKR